MKENVMIWKRVIFIYVQVIERVVDLLLLTMDRLKPKFQNTPLIPEERTANLIKYCQL